jgi:hypothetical protein
MLSLYWILVISVAAVLTTSAIIATLWFTVFSKETKSEKEAAIIAPISKTVSQLSRWTSFTQIQTVENNTGVFGLAPYMNASGTHFVVFDMHSDLMQVYSVNPNTGQYSNFQSNGMGTTLSPSSRAVISNDGHTVICPTAEGNICVISGDIVTTIEQPGYTFGITGVCYIVTEPKDPLRFWANGYAADGSGRIFIFEGLVIVGYIEPAHGSAPYDAFACHFDVSGDYLVAAYPLNRTAQVFRRETYTSPFTHFTTFDPNLLGSEFPSQVAISSRGDWLVLSDPTDTIRLVDSAGSLLAAYWNEKQLAFVVAKTKITQPVPEAMGFFGSSLSSSPDGLFVCVGHHGLQGQTWVYEYRVDLGYLVLHTVISGSVVPQNEDSFMGLSTSFSMYSPTTMRLLIGQTHSPPLKGGHVFVLESKYT